MRIPVRCCMLILALSAAGGAGAQNSVGAFDGQTDVGRVRHPGSASYGAARQSYLLTGDFILSTRASFVAHGAEPHRKLGWTIRPSLEPNAAHVSAAVHGNGLV